ncbi:hypothetical protein [Halomonas sp. RA08-2]|uniref:hypothetical protein n=1 Tax=Halomonas sp. RA08-2 TaxID=3440842 RepID=UPI003EEB0DF0
MNLVYLMPFSYFYNTRLRNGSVAFHLIFEWLAAVVLALAIGAVDPAQALLAAGLSYLAFISLYEVGYLINDLFSARKEDGGRTRGPQGVSITWVASWFGSRFLVFIIVTALMGHVGSPEWWAFFLALVLVFGLHNWLNDRELKVATFQWLGWLRFMAPVIFVVDEAQLAGVGLAAAVAYVGFRIFGYLDSKGLLLMPGRQSSTFRLFYFLMPMTGVLVLWPYDAAKGYIILSSYFAAVAVLGTLPQLVRSEGKA